MLCPDILFAMPLVNFHKNQEPQSASNWFQVTDTADLLARRLEISLYLSQLAPGQVEN